MSIVRRFSLTDHQRVDRLRYLVGIGGQINVALLSVQRGASVYVPVADPGERLLHTCDIGCSKTAGSAVSSGNDKWMRSEARGMADRPNVLLLSTHDSGRFFGCYGVETVHTPAIDRLAAEGCRFTDFFAACPQCAPSRSALLTGEYPQRNGMMGLPSPAFGWSLRDDATHLSERLADADYHTALFGFQHEATDLDRLEFETADADVRPGPDLAPDVADFFDEYDDDRPFYAQVGLFETHEPLDFGGAEPGDADDVTIPPYIDETDAAREYFAQLQGLLRQADEAVRTILDGLERAGVVENTIVAFTSDHGITFSRAKGYLYDAGIRVPLLLRWPEGGIVGGETCEWLVSNVDFVPTILELLDLPVPDGLDGRSFAAFQESNASPPRDAIHAMYHDHRRWGFGPDARCVRTRNHKLIHNFESDARFDIPIGLDELGRLGRDGLKTGGPRPIAELYDLRKDPDEFENVADDPVYSEVHADLDTELWEWLEMTDDPILEGPPPSPYYEQAIEKYKKSGGPHES